MVDSRTITAAAGLIASLVISIAAYVYFDTLALFLFIPFIPLLFGGRASGSSEGSSPAVRRCPVCDYRTTNPEHGYCPRDGTELE